MKTSNELRFNPMWKETYEIVEYIYGKIVDLISNFPDEQWNTASKLRNAASDSLFYVSLAVGNISEMSGEYDWNYARKYLFLLQSMYIFATKQKFLELEPEIIVKIDKLLREIEVQIKQSKRKEEERNKKELERWLEKYRLWLKIQK